VDGVTLGKVRPRIAQLLCHATPHAVFAMNNSTLTFSPAVGTTVQARTAAVASVMEALRDQNKMKGWRHELYPVAAGFYDDPVFLMERVAVPWLGCLEYGVHVNGFVVNDGEIRMWMARRSPTKSKFPGLLDHIAAGGQPAGLSLRDNVVKECFEEAGIPPEYLTLESGNLTPNGAVSYETYNPGSDTVSRAVIFNYDLLLPTSFKPVAVDGGKEIRMEQDSSTALPHLVSGLCRLRRGIGVFHVVRRPSHPIDGSSVPRSHQTQLLPSDH
jgi:8-oxo-dGTP pyrophosphatase MutT (NUDIX family)